MVMSHVTSQKERGSALAMTTVMTVSITLQTCVRFSFLYFYKLNTSDILHNITSIMFFIFVYKMCELLQYTFHILFIGAKNW